MEFLTWFLDMAENHHVGRKYLWVGNEGVLEMHGEEKMAWTKLEEHIFRKRLKKLLIYA